MGILDSLFGRDANPDPKNLQDYPSLLAAAKKNPASINFVSIRKAYKVSPLYHPYESNNNNAFAALDLLKAGKSAEAVSAVAACLEKYYLDVDAHMCASIIYRQMGDMAKYSFHNHFTQGLIKAIMSTGNGMSFETAFEVMNIPEEYTIMNVLGVKQQNRKTVMNDNRKYDVHQVTDKNGGTYELYFNVDFNTNIPVAPKTPAAPKTQGVNIPILKIGNVEWMTRNLNTDKFSNGEIIPEAKSKEEWIKAGREGKPAWCYHDNDPSLSSEHGRLYNWFAINDPRGLLPQGWRIPDNNDWLALINGFGGKGFAGINLKSASGWNNNGNGTNQSGFNGLPSGGRIFENETSAFAAMFTGLGQVASWWSLEESTKEKVWTYSLVFAAQGVARLESRKEAGCSVRGVRGGEKPAAKEVVATIYFSSTKAVTENTLREAAKPFAPIGKINWSNKSKDSPPGTADGLSYFYVEQSEARGTFQFSYTLWWRALSQMPDQRQQVDFLKRVSSLQQAEILTHAGGPDPYNFIYLQPGQEATLVSIDVEADNNNDELKIEEFTSTGWGIFAVSNILNMEQMQWIKQSFQKYVPGIRLSFIARDNVNPHFIEAQLDLIDLQPFVNHYLLFPEGKTKWYSNDEKSVITINIFEEFQRMFRIPVCLFPVNGTVIENIPGGSDSQSHCVLIREKGSQKVVYKTRRKSW